MRNIEAWRPSKFVFHDGVLRGSRDPRELGVRSRMIGDLEAAVYSIAIRKHARGVLADVGCGKVPLYEVYKDLVTDIICVDWPNTWHKTSHLDIEQDLNEGLSLPDASVDTVLSTDVLEHLCNPDRFWSEVARVMRPGGKLILTVPFLYWLHEEPHDYRRFTQHELRRACAASGLRVVELNEFGGPLTVILDICGKNTPWFISQFQAFACWLSRTRIGRRIDERGAKQFPLGYCLVASAAGSAG